MINNKSILLICKEKSSFPMFFLGKELEKNNNVNYFFTHNTEVLNKTKFNQGTFFYFKKNIKNEKIHDVRDISIEFLKNHKNIQINSNRLNEIEKKYTYFTCLNKQILSSQALSTAYHYRFEHTPTTYNENLYWLTLNYNKIEDIFKKVKPDYIFDIDTGEIQRTIINEVAHYNKIPYVTIDHSRYKDFFLPSFTLGRHIDKYFVNTYEKNLKNSETNNYLSLIEKYKLQSSIMPEIYRGESASVYNFSFFSAMKFILRKTYKGFRTILYSRLNEYKISFNTPLYPKTLKKILFFYFYSIRKFYLYSRFNKYFTIPKNEKYVYLPLHKIPESSTFVKAPMYINELNLIEAISKSLPISWKLYVKEHQSMIGERKIEFYKKIKKFHNVKIVQSNYYKDPKPWIEKSLCVVTITGTTGFEATMLNKPVIVFGNVFYGTIKGVKFASGFEELENIFKEIELDSELIDNSYHCAAYLKTIHETGTKFNLKDLTNLSEKKMLLKLDKIEEKQFLELLNNFKFFYEKAINIYNNEKK